ncbi:MAG TPA: sulfotransferase [Pirellulales bacterium]|nr:sulfotransferase [Pirellulales bacterium]
MNKFFVVGCPRSGTTLLQQALNRHSQIAIPPETSFATLVRSSYRRQVEHVRCINADLGISLPLPAAQIRRLEDVRLLYDKMADGYVKRLGRAVTHFGEKTPRHQRFLPQLWTWFPDAKVVLIYRDGRDVALSLSKVPWMPGDVRVGFALWLHYVRAQRRVPAARASQLHLVRYEDFVTFPERELRSVAAFLGLDYEPAMADACGNREGINPGEADWKAAAAGPISEARIGRWREELSTAELCLLERWGGRALGGLGYALATGGGPWPLMTVVATYLNALRWILRNPPHADARALARAGRMIVPPCSDVIRGEGSNTI